MQPTKGDSSAMLPDTGVSAGCVKPNNQNEGTLRCK